MTTPISTVPSAATVQQPTSLIPAKKLKENNTQQDSMSLPKQTMGPIEAPQSTYKYSVNNDVNTKHAETKDIWDSATKPTAATSLGSTKKKSGLFSTLLKIGAVGTAAVLLMKKVKLSSIDTGNIASLKDINKHFSDVINAAKTGKLKPFNLKKTCVRVVDESGDNIKEILSTTRKIAAEAKNVEGKTPKIIIKLTDDAGDIQKTIKEAICKNKIDKLDESILKKIEYINLEYIKSDAKARNIVVETMNSSFTDNSNGATEGLNKAGKFFRDFFKD